MSGGTIMSRLRESLRHLSDDPGEAARRDYVGGLVALWLPAPFIIGFNAVAFGGAGISYGVAGEAAITFPMYFLPIALMYTFHRFNPLVSASAHSLAYLMFMSGLLYAYTYATTALGAGIPLRDGLLHRADALMGFDWLAWLETANRLAGEMPLLSSAAAWAYGSMAAQVFVVTVALVATRSHARIQTLWLAYVLSLVAVGAIAGAFPAVGTYEFYGVVDSLHPNLDLVVRSHHVEHYTALRGGGFQTFMPDEALGIITFPSFHSTSAVLFTWAFWSMSLLRWPAVAVNALMLIATPFHGSHFLSDVIAGAVVGVLSIWVAHAMRRSVVSGVSALMHRMGKWEMQA